MLGGFYYFVLFTNNPQHKQKYDWLYYNEYPDINFLIGHV